MKNRLYESVNRIWAAKTKRRRIVSVLLVLSLFVTGSVFWMLRGVGTAMTEEALCGMTQHLHTNACYQTVPISLSNGSDPSSGAGVTVEQSAQLLICQLSEHIHSAACIPELAADMESKNDWEKTLPKALSENRQENTALIAESQLGYQESATNFLLSDDGLQRRNFSRYGKWYGNPYGDWNTMFVFFCMYYAGVAEHEIPYGSGCWPWLLRLQEAELFTAAANGMPVRGDIVFMDSDADSKADRVGVVIEALANQSDASKLIIIEGDCDGAVAVQTISWQDSKVLGYVSLAGKAEYGPVAVSKMPAQEFDGTSDSGILVHASASENTFPSGTYMVVTDVTDNVAISTAKIGIGSENKVLGAVAVDISFYTAEGEEIEPAAEGNVQVRIALPDERKLDGEEYRLLHKMDDGTVESIEQADTSETGATFAAESFSIYVVTALGQRDKDNINEYLDMVGNVSPNDGKFYYNSETSPYILHPGDAVELQFVTDADAVSPGIWSSAVGFSSNVWLQREYGGYSEDTREGVYNGKRYLRCRYVAKSFSDVNLDDYSNASDEDRTKLGLGRIVFNTGLKDEDGNDISESFYFRVMDDENATYDHADIEIADGGSYVITETIHSPDGSKIVTKTIFDAYVYDVNTCRIFNENNENILYRGGELAEYFTTKDYWKHGELGTSQFELTSKYNLDTGYWSNYRISQNDVHHAEFDVQLLLKPNRIETVTTDQNGNVIDTKTTITKEEVTQKHHTISFDETTWENRNNPIIINEGDTVTLTGISTTSGTTYYFPTNAGVAPPEGEWRYEKSDLLGEMEQSSDGDTRIAEFEAVSFSRDNSMVQGICLNIGKNEDGNSMYRTIYFKVNDGIGENDLLSDSVIFNMDHQSVVDAVNKCPNHSGLDFTLKADLNMETTLEAVSVDIEARKILKNGTLNAGDFTFQLLDGSDIVLQEHVNDTDGTVKFAPLSFMKPGTYYYFIQEKIPSETDGILYDTNRTDYVSHGDITRGVTVQVTQDSSTKELSATVSYWVYYVDDNGNETWTPVPESGYHEIVNEVILYELPETGGCGMEVFWFGGAAILALGSLLLIRRNRKESVPHSPE